MKRQHETTSNYPKDWKFYRLEIHRLLRTADPDYKLKKYITQYLYTGDIEIHPEKYPRLNKLNSQTFKRYVSYFLRDLKRRKNGKSRKTTVWVNDEE